MLKPTDICEAHFKALNIELNPGCSIEDMLPAAEPGSSYLPSLAESDKLATDNAPHVDATKARTGPERKRKDFHDRVAELRLDNAMAYRAITRNFKQGVKPPRLAYMRVFWQGLESMSQYWDCTMDQYYSVDEDDPTSEHSPKRQKLDSFSSMSNSDADASEASDALPVRTSNCDASSTTTTQTPAAAFHSTDLGKWATSMDEDLTPPIELAEFVGPTLRSRSGMRYKGLRTNSGRYMPDQFRVEAVRGFVEGAVWPFQCSVYLPRMMPLVHFNKLNLPVRQSVAVYQLPKDRARAKAGGLVGPVLGVQVRPETEFGDDEAKARLDVMREIGGLLQLAQERAREGKKEIKPGEGKWWTTVPRWGGGLGGEVEDQQGNSDIVDIAAELLDATRGEPGKATREASRKRQKKTPAVLWKELKCGSGYFDPKTDYAAIGKNPASEADEVGPFYCPPKTYKLNFCLSRSSSSPHSTTISQS